MKPPPGWDERRGWAYLLWVGHLARRPKDHARHPCDACKIARMMGLTDQDRKRLLDSSPAGPDPLTGPNNVVQLRKPG